MSNVNKVFLIGNLTRDPELKFTPQGTAIANFSIAVNRSFKAGTGELKKQTDFFNIIGWGKLGETCAKFLSKGRPVHVEGRLQTRSYEASDQKKRTVTEIIAENVQFLGSPQKQGNSMVSEISPSKTSLSGQPSETVPSMDDTSGMSDQESDSLAEDIPF